MCRYHKVETKLFHPGLFNLEYFSMTLKQTAEEIYQINNIQIIPMNKNDGN
jgi:hypothetical protein